MNVESFGLSHEYAQIVICRESMVAKQLANPGLLETGKIKQCLHVCSI